MDNEEVINIFSKFNSNDFNIFQELTQIGHITHTFDWANHEFVIRTLTIDEEIVVGQLIKHLDGTIVQDKALITAIVAACLVSVDGKSPFPPSVVNDPVVILREHYRMISEKWHWPVVVKINEQYLILQEKMYKTISDIENLSQEGRMKSMDNSTDSFDPSKDYPFSTGEDPTNFS